MSASTSIDRNPSAESSIGIYQATEAEASGNGDEELDEKTTPRPAPKGSGFATWLDTFRSIAQVSKVLTHVLRCLHYANWLKITSNLRNTNIWLIVMEMGAG
jgi:hypothetical protein